MEGVLALLTVAVTSLALSIFLNLSKGDRRKLWDCLGIARRAKLFNSDENESGEKEIPETESDKCKVLPIISPSFSQEEKRSIRCSTHNRKCIYTFAVISIGLWAFKLKYGLGGGALRCLTSQTLCFTELLPASSSREGYTRVACLRRNRLASQLRGLPNSHHERTLAGQSATSWNHHGCTMQLARRLTTDKLRRTRRYLIYFFATTFDLSWYLIAMYSTDTLAVLLYLSVRMGRILRASQCSKISNHRALLLHAKTPPTRPAL